MLMTKNAYNLLDSGTKIILPSVAKGCYFLPEIISKAEQGEPLTVEDAANLRELHDSLNSLWLSFIGVVNAVQAAGTAEQENGE